MHPLTQSRLRLALYLLAWAVLGALIAVLLAITRGTPIVNALALMEPLALLYGLVCLSALWVCRSLPLDRTPPGKLLGGWIGAALQASAVWVGVGTPWAVLLGRAGVISARREELMGGAAAFFVLGIPLYLGSLVLHYLLLAFEASREAERRVLESQVTAREAELRALRAQLNPHFLFNSLNSINALVGVDPERARRMCESLGDFLRRTLALGARDSVSLSEELALVDRYFAIERVRFGDRLEVERDVEPAAERCLVPPLLLQPLVENAIKHGVADRIEGGTVRVAAQIADGALRLSVENAVDEDSAKRPGEGVGLQNVRRRLDALSARQTRLDTRRENGRFRVMLTLPVRLAAETGAAGPAARST
ncbi:MAG TPA: histidine kinase [Candidatus Eisenbacteria bacterium]|jgi:two-component sensor histidine kinase